MLDINSDNELADKPVWFKRMIAGVGDMLSMINNAAANNAYLRTAFTRQAVMDLCQLIGYEVPDATTSAGMVVFNLNPDTAFLPHTIKAKDLVSFTKGDNPLRFEGRSDCVIPNTYTTGDNATIVSSAFAVNKQFYVGQLIRFDGTLPAALKKDTNYYAIPISDTRIQVATTLQRALNGVYINIVATTGYTQIYVYSGAVTCYQQEYKEDILLGTAGNEEWQEFDLPDAKVLRDTLQIKINGITWERVDSLVFSKATEQKYQYVQLLDRKSYIRFGNNEYGAIPPNFPILASYYVGGGANTNVNTIGNISVYGGGDADVTEAINVTTMSGGSDPQSIEVAKKIAPGLLKSRDRFVTTEDGENLAIGYGGIALCKVFPNFYGILSAKVVCVALGGGNPTALRQAEIQQYLIDRSILNSIDVRVVNSTIVKRNVSSQCVVLPGYEVSFVKDLFRIAWKMFLTETGQEIVDAYQSGGIDYAIETIQMNLGETITAEMYDTVEEIIQDMLNSGVRQFGETVQQSEAVSFIQGNIKGVDYMTITSPTFPLTHAVDAISSVGTVTIT
jgi:hypothetical protein